MVANHFKSRPVRPIKVDRFLPHPFLRLYPFLYFSLKLLIVSELVTHKVSGDFKLKYPGPQCEVKSLAVTFGRNKKKKNNKKAPNLLILEKNLMTNCYFVFTWSKTHIVLNRFTLCKHTHTGKTLVHQVSVCVNGCLSSNDSWCCCSWSSDSSINRIRFNTFSLCPWGLKKLNFDEHANHLKEIYIFVLFYEGKRPCRPYMNTSKTHKNCVIIHVIVKCQAWQKKRSFMRASQRLQCRH